MNDRTERRNVTDAASDIEFLSLQAELEELRAELAEERSRRRVAEALADERATALDHARVALKALEALAAAVAPDPEPPRPKPRGQWLK